jgi:hypothetical protein
LTEATVGEMLMNSASVLSRGDAASVDRKRLENLIAFARLSRDPAVRRLASPLEVILVNLDVAEGELAEAARRLDRLLAPRSASTLSAGDRRRLRFMRCLVSTVLRDSARLADDLDAFLEDEEGRLRAATWSLSSRAAAAAAAKVRDECSIVAETLWTEPDETRRAAILGKLFDLHETARDAQGTTVRLKRRAALRGTDVVDAALARVARATARAAEAASGSAERLGAAVAEREAAERALSALLAPTDGASEDRGLASLRARLAAEDVYVSYWRRTETPRDSALFNSSVEVFRYVAFVVRREAPLALVDLGPAPPIDDAVAAWRASVRVGAGSRGIEDEAHAARARGAGGAAGAALVRALIDPVRRAAPDATRWITAPDGEINLLPLDALPLGDGVVGDLIRIVAGSVADVVGAADTAASVGATIDGEALFVGDADFTALVAPPAAASRPSSVRVRTMDRGAFPPLPATRAEIAAAAASWSAASGRRATTLVREHATKAAFVEAAPRARLIHVATHGFFAPDRFKALGRATAETAGIAAAAGVSDVVAGFSPSLLCGLAFAGAGGPDETAAAEAVLTAEELSTLDLAQCELAVLSACETNVGAAPARFGIDLATLRRALHAAGVRHAVTSLWKVPDEATRVLMEEFYRRRFVLNEPVRDSLWNAKMMMREAKGPHGGPRFLIGDWAGWVATGPPQ